MSFVASQPFLAPSFAEFFNRIAVSGLSGRKATAGEPEGEVMPRARTRACAHVVLPTLATFVGLLAARVGSLHSLRFTPRADQS
jgi:hypothetical protein